MYYYTVYNVHVLFQNGPRKREFRPRLSHMVYYNSTNSTFGQQLLLDHNLRDCRLAHYWLSY